MIPGSAWNWRRTSSITVWAARLTARMASALKRNTSIAPSNAAVKIGTLPISTMKGRVGSQCNRDRTWSM